MFHSTAHEQFIVPPLPAAVHAPAEMLSAPDEIISNWLDDIDKSTSELKAYITHLELDSLSYWIDVINSSGKGYRTNILSVRDALDVVLNTALKDTDKAVADAKKLARLLHNKRSPLAYRANKISQNFTKVVKSVHALFLESRAHSERIIDLLPDPKNTEVNRAIGVYEQALKLVIGKEGFSWTLHNIQTADPTECFPWFEVFVSSHVRSDRNKLRNWEEKIDQAVEDADPRLLGSVGVNYSIAQHTA